MSVEEIQLQRSHAHQVPVANGWLSVKRSVVLGDGTGEGTGDVELGVWMAGSRTGAGCKKMARRWVRPLAGPSLLSTTGRAGLAVAGSAGRQGPEACIRLVVVRGTRLAVVRGTRLAAWGLRTPG